MAFSKLDSAIISIESAILLIVNWISFNSLSLGGDKTQFAISSDDLIGSPLLYGRSIPMRIRLNTLVPSNAMIDLRPLCPP